jgi:hypothetical protein
MNNSQYFYRTIIFSQKDNQVAIADIHQPEKISPLEGWMGIVISLADGHHSIQELIDYLRGRYAEPPQNLEKTLHSIIERLEEGKLLQLSSKAVTLPYYLASPIEQLDLQKAKGLIQEDGYDSISELH